MKTYIGTKRLNAEPMTKGEAYDRSLLRGEIVEAERETHGYHVVYPDGYESWSPKDVFEDVYCVAETPLDCINIEYQDLDNKVGKIAQFKQTETYNNLREVDRACLDVQFNIMQNYLGILGNRAISMKTGDGGLCGFDFGIARYLLTHGYVLRRNSWNGKGVVVFKQVPATINDEIIPKMQSLPAKAKEVILNGVKHIDYTSQCLIYNRMTGRADSWVPSISDVFAEDWELVIE